MFFCRSSASNSGGSSFVALVGNRLLLSPRHVTGINAATKAAVSTSARSTVARIIAGTPDVEPLLSGCVYSVAFVGQPGLSSPEAALGHGQQGEPGWFALGKRPKSPATH